MMKRTLKILVVCATLVFGGITLANAQQPPAGQTDTVNMDTEAVPTFYYDIEDNESTVGNDKNSAGTIAIIIGAVVVVGVVAYFLLKKKK
jgi:hypothetical protein